jgi:hypothetical protein
MGVSTWSVPRSFLNENWGDKVSPSREFVKRGLELVKLRISTVRSRCQETVFKDIEDWKSLAGAVVICELWRLAVAQYFLHFRVLCV